jgi:nitroreductase
MELKTVIERRRAFRSLEYVDITEDIIEDLANSANLAASCFNNQPWKYVFVYDKEVLKELHQALSSGNEWAKAASMIIAVMCKKEDDCVIRDREYYLFDTGMATAQMILRATDMGLVAHPIAGFSPKTVREVLAIPKELQVITLVIVGKHSAAINPLMNKHQVEVENERPDRQPLSEFTFMNRYNNEE